MYLDVLKRIRPSVDLEYSTLLEAMVVAAPYASGRLIDVGCGDKPYESLFRPHVSEYVGTEYAPTYHKSLSAMRGKADVLYSGIRLPFEDNAFDTVLCNQVVEHVPEPRRFLADLARVLRPGGRLILTVPFSFRIHSVPHDFHRFTRFALERHCTELDLEIDRLESRGGVWIVIGQKLASHLALRTGRLGGDIQTIGALRYEETISPRPRYWLLPFAAPVIVGITTAARILDALDHDDSDTLGYLLIATKNSAQHGHGKGPSRRRNSSAARPSGDPTS